MLEIFLETLVDNLKLFPFLFAAYLLLEYLEHKASAQTLEKIVKSEKMGPLIGAVCGIIPQCGFSAAAANFYAARVISLGTLMAIFLSTSDEMLPVMLAQSMSLKTISLIISYKFVYGLICGILLDFCIKSTPHKVEITEICHNANCSCERENSLIKAAFFHAINITIFIFFIALVLNLAFKNLPLSEGVLQFMQKPLISDVLAALFGLIPNCSPSVILTQLYIADSINLSTMLSGTLTGSGVGILILFKINRNLVENFKIMLLIYFFGVSGGLMSNLFTFLPQ